MSEFEASPSQVLAERVVQRLIAEGLLAPGDATRIQTRLVDGKLKPEDWRVAIEKAADAAARAGARRGGEGLP